MLWWVLWSKMRFSGLLKIDLFIILGGVGFWRSLLSGWSGVVASYLRFDEWMVVWESIGSNLASLFTMSLFVSAVWPVAMLAIWLWTICRQMVEIKGGNDGSPGCASILKYGSVDGFVGVYYDPLFPPWCTCKWFVNFYGLVSFCFGVFYVFGEGEFGVECEA